MYVIIKGFFLSQAFPGSLLTFAVHLKFSFLKDFTFLVQGYICTRDCALCISGKVVWHYQIRPNWLKSFRKCTVKPRNLLILGPSKIVPQIAKSADCKCYCM